MSANLLIQNGQASMFYINEVPWHGLGTAFEEADLYDWPSACRKAGLEWEAERVPLLTADKQERVARYAVRRKSDGRIIGTMGPRCTFLTNSSVMHLALNFDSATPGRLSGSP